MISIGDKVVCVDDGESSLSAEWDFVTPHGDVKKGEVYVVEGFYRAFNSVGVRIVGKPCYCEGVLVGWNIKRFRKLEDYKAEQEIAYYRSLPAEQPVFIPIRKHSTLTNR